MELGLGTGSGVSGSGTDLAQAAAWHRQVSAMVAAADRAGVAGALLPAIQSRLATQASVLAETAARLGAPQPALVPAAGDIATAGRTLGDLSEGAVATAVASMESTMDAIDAALAGRQSTVESGHVVAVAPPQPVPAQHSWPPAVPVASPAPIPPPQPGPAPVGRGVFVRNGAIYGAYSAVVLAVQILLFLVLDEESSLPRAAPLCLLVLPALAWAAGFLTISVMFAPGPDGKRKLTPRLGVVVCLVPNALLLCALGALFVIHQAG